MVYHLCLLCRLTSFLFRVVSYSMSAVSNRTVRHCLPRLAGELIQMIDDGHLERSKIITFSSRVIVGKDGLCCDLRTGAYPGPWEGGDTSSPNFDKLVYFHPPGLGYVPRYKYIQCTETVSRASSLPKIPQNIPKPLVLGLKGLEILVHLPKLEIHL